MELHPGLQDGALRWKVVSADLCCLLGIRVPGPPQLPGSPVGVQQTCLDLPELHPHWPEARKRGLQQGLMLSLSRVRTEDPTASQVLTLLAAD